MSHHYAKVPTNDRDQGTDHFQSHSLQRARSEALSPVRLPSFSDSHGADTRVCTSPNVSAQGDNDGGKEDNNDHDEDDEDLDLQTLSFGEDNEVSEQQQQQQQLLTPERQEEPQRHYREQSAPSSNTKYKDFRRALDPYLSLFSSTSSSASSSSAAGGGGPSSSATSARRLPFSSTADGVFANISAKPEVEGQKNQELQPPAYDSAIQDVTPPYFEMTVVSPRAFGDDVLVDGLPVGNFFQFLWNVAGKLFIINGSMVGLGITLLHFGIRMRGGFGFASLDSHSDGPGVGEVTQVDRPPLVDDTGYMGGSGRGGMDPPTYGSAADSAQMDWLQSEAENQWASLLLMIVGWMIMMKALAAYVVAKKTERIISSQPSGEREHSRASIDSITSDHYV
ncbi:hypothetical protein EC968_002314 [Mortierella alpina]|nr:hypothetical protein EC968_002314 [Mortierella alpina]